MTKSRSKSQGGRTSPYALGVRRHAPLVESVARRIHAGLPRSVQLEDLIQDGARGLIRAIKSFDPTAGLAFTQHARIIVHRRILSGLRRTRRQTRVAPLTDALPLLAEEGPASAASALPDARADCPVAALMNAEIRAAIGERVSKEEALILRATLVEERGQAEIAAMLGCSQSQVSRQLARLMPPLLARLRASPRLQELAGIAPASPSPGTPGEASGMGDCPRAGRGEGLLSTTNHARRAQGRAQQGRQGRRRTDAERGGAPGQTRRRPAQDGTLPSLKFPPIHPQPGPPCPRKEAS